MMPDPYFPDPSMVTFGCAPIAQPDAAGLNAVNLEKFHQFCRRASDITVRKVAFPPTGPG